LRCNDIGVAGAGVLCRLMVTCRGDGDGDSSCCPGKVCTWKAILWEMMVCRCRNIGNWTHICKGSLFGTNQNGCRRSHCFGATRSFGTFAKTVFGGTFHWRYWRTSILQLEYAILWRLFRKLKSYSRFKIASSQFGDIDALEYAILWRLFRKLKSYSRFKIASSQFGDIGAHVFCNLSTPYCGVSFEN
jgi:hypothetical protein